MILVIYLLNLNQNVSNLTIYKAISNIVNSWLQLNVIPSKVLKCICGRNSKNRLYINVNVAAILVIMWLQRPQKNIHTEAYIAVSMTADDNLNRSYTNQESHLDF